MRLFTTFLTLSILVLPAIVAANPWEQRFAEAATAKPLPTQLPEHDYRRGNTQESYKLTFEEAEMLISQQLEQRGAGESVEVTIIQRRIGELLQHHTPLEIEVGNLFFDAASQKWEAVLYPQSQGRSLAPISLEGRYREMVSVPVLRKRVRHGETIDEIDIIEVSLAENRLREDTVLDKAQLIGMSPKRAISENRPIRRSEIDQPPVIHEGDNVTMQFRGPSLLIKTTGRALNAGAAGDRIRVRNDESHTVIQAKILGTGMVEAVPLGTLVAAK